ncbi:DegT/DnrJ/EryC1/StrS family aminotransferase [Streptomyces pathocidini]|uniref:DegT/DnrJ/EryC1/StrS family aminotransferase n=1 Tax=Streptomyces pathocidini TaxID=1650571 RepID=A0ABW7UJ86_9ACTN|nr:DegT/DnrJ/EryC1/StrS family aminotransferase [Streptomyces pathocidini]
MALGQPVDGLQRDLTSAGVCAGDEVIVPSFGSVGVVEAVRLAGGVPVFVDIDPGSFCVDPAAVEAAVSPRTAAIVPVHQFGHRADMARLGELARRQGLFLIAYGGEVAREGSAAEVAVRRANAAFLTRRLNDVITPMVRPGAEHAFLQYVVRVPGNGRPDRDAFARTLCARGVRCQVPVQTPVHRMPPFRRDVWLPETERAADECLALPVEAGLTRRELQRVVSACNALGGLLLPA